LEASKKVEPARVQTLEALASFAAPSPARVGTAEWQRLHTAVTGIIK